MWGHVTSKTVLRIGYKSLKKEYRGLEINGLDAGSSMSAASNDEEKHSMEFDSNLLQILASLIHCIFGRLGERT